MMIEPIERRLHFSVTVTEGYPGFYEVQGDSSNDVIVVTVDQVNQTFELNNTTYTGVEYIFVDGGDGDDEINVQAFNFGSIGSSILGGEGDDEITINFDGAVGCGPGNDVVYMIDSFRGEVYGEDGHDELYISGYCVDAEVDGGDGDDYLDATNNYYGATLRGGNGDDTILGSFHDDTIWGGSGVDTVYGNGGGDVFNMIDGTGDNINGGSGDDWLYGDSSEGSVTSVEHIS